jgi:hypothetical protein
VETPNSLFIPVTTSIIPLTKIIRTSHIMES